MPRGLSAWTFFALAALAMPDGYGQVLESSVNEHAIDVAVAQGQAATHAKALAFAVIEDGRPVFVRTYGPRNKAGAALHPDTVMYAASFTKPAFAYMLMQLVDEGRIGLDVTIEHYLPRPLPAYKPWSALNGDDRWRRLTPRILLTHSSGLANLRRFEPDGTLRFHFDPGARYAYSGEGMNLLQFVLEQGLHLDVGREMQRRVFDRFGMSRTSMTWRPDFSGNVADGWDSDGRPVEHDERTQVQAAGSMDTTVTDFSRFAAGFIRGDGLSPSARRELTRSQLVITTASQFPSLQPEIPPAHRVPHLAAGLGVVLFDGPQGTGFMKGGHDDATGNTWVCIEAGRRCVIIMSNDVRAESAFPGLVQAALGNTGVPWTWEYGH